MSQITRGLLIGGKEIGAQGDRLTDDVSPWTGSVYARVAAASPSDVKAAIDAAEAAFPAWSAMLPYERRKIFL